MKHIITGAALSVIAISAAAQETYESAQIATEDLNGTARYIGMGGAMEALGGDISTISTNPAGTAMFRRPWAGISGGATIQKGSPNSASGLYDNGASNADFNQAGFIFANKVGANSWFNLGFNYHKGRNFNQVANTSGILDGVSSSNALTAYSYNAYSTGCSMLEAIDISAVYERTKDASGTLKTSGAQDYSSNTKTSGYTSNFDFNFSGNINDRVYIGLTVGIKDVRYDQTALYDETLGNYTDKTTGRYSLTSSSRLRGTGFDVKFGAIFRPIEDSPFRFGVYVHTPTWYELSRERTINVMTQFGTDKDGKNIATDGKNICGFYQEGSNYNKFKVTTPWKFGVTAGTTFGNNIALGVTYQFSDYSTINNRYKTGSYVSNYYNYSETRNTYADDVLMNRNTKSSLKGVHLLKVGMEVKPLRTLAIRVGYNYESAMYSVNGSKDYTTNNTQYYSGYYYTLHDWVNWGATHRITVGLGFQLSKMVGLDLSYQYNTQNGTYYPFQSVNGTIEGKSLCINGTPCDIKNTRHLLNATLGFRF